MLEIEKESKDNRIVYYKKGTKIIHREDGPAVEWTDGTKEWYRNGKRHREDGPALIFINGRKEWYKYGKFHRDDGPAVEGADGSVKWYIHGKLHREDGPAIIDKYGRKYWYKKGLMHREDGPAFTGPFGKGSYLYLNGTQYNTKESWFEAMNEEQKKKALFSAYFIIGIESN